MNTCLGIAWLGVCAYDPANPSPTYFAPGSAVAALAFTLAVQSFLKPIYRLRLALRRFSLSRLYVLIFVAVSLTIVAALVPSLPFLHGGWWGYPVVYELLAVILFTVAYGAVAIAVACPITISDTRVEHFARLTASYLSAATESDHVDLLPDLENSVSRLISLAAFVDVHHEQSAFYLFVHRQKIRQASYAYSILRILSDPPLCRSLVVRAPWKLAQIVRDISEKKIHTNAAEHFVQELAHQAISSDEGIMAREVEHQGFRDAPVLSDALFSDPFIVRMYNPLGTHFQSDEITPSILKRFNHAAVRCYESLIEQKEFYPSQVSYSIKAFYRSAGFRANALRKFGSTDFSYAMEFGEAVENTINIAKKLMAAADNRSYEAMFETDDDQSRSQPLEVPVEIVYEALCSVSNEFKGPSDVFWHLAISTMIDGFNSIGDEPDGMTPFQQRLALKFKDKLKDNMDGFYPAICRVLLATVGPYSSRAQQPNLTAFNILRDTIYVELKRLPQLAKSEPGKVSDYLPENLTYDADKTVLTHTFTGGSTAETDLSALEIAKVDLLDHKYRRALTDSERASANTPIYY